MAGVSPGSFSSVGSGTNATPLSNVILNVYAQEILFKAQPILKFESIAVKRNELNVLPGGQLNFLKYNSLTGSAALVEATAISTNTLSTTVIPITVSEQGYAVAVSELLLRQAITNVMDDTTTLLGMHYASHRDYLIASALYGGTNVLWSQAGGNAASRADLTTSSTFNVDLIRAAVEQLATNKAPKFGLDAYVCFVHPHQARYLRTDTAWINANNYAMPENLLAGEIGRIEDVRFIETTQVQYIPAGGQEIYVDSLDSGSASIIATNSNTDTYRSVIVGMNSVGLAESLPVELRDNGVEDFGRRHSLAYYGIWGAGIIESGHSVILETA